MISTLQEAGGVSGERRAAALNSRSLTGAQSTQESLSQSRAVAEQMCFHNMHTIVHTSIVAVPWLTRSLHSVLMVLEVTSKCIKLAGAKVAAFAHKNIFKSCFFRFEPQSCCQAVPIRVPDANSRLTLLLRCLRRSDRKPLLK